MKLWKCNDFSILKGWSSDHVSWFQLSPKILMYRSSSTPAVQPFRTKSSLTPCSLWGPVWPMNLLHMWEAPYRAVELSSGGGLMGSGGRASASGGGVMPGHGGGTETGHHSTGALLHPGRRSRWWRWRRRHTDASEPAVRSPEFISSYQKTSQRWDQYVIHQPSRVAETGANVYQ